jgi:hypothetical protein
MKAHIIENGVVVNTILVNSIDALPGVTLVEATEGSIGWIFDGSVFTNPTAAADMDIITPLAKDMRYKRDSLLKETVDTLNGVRWSLMTNTQQTAWAAYRQALLDVPTQEGFPKTIVWPIQP